MTILETERLILRLLTPDDATNLYRIYSDPETMKFMGDPPVSIEDERSNIQSHIANHYDKNGIGLWATVNKEDNRLIGRCGLMRKLLDGVDEVEIAWLLDRAYWRRGLASEAARAIIGLGFRNYGFNRIVAIIDPANMQSIRVAEKMGMTYEKDVIHGKYGTMSLYSLSS